jgi:hypothetical protein
MEWANLFGKMGNNSKASGNQARKMGLVSGSLPRATITKVNGRKTNKMERDCTTTAVLPNTRDISRIS